MSEVGKKSELLHILPEVARSQGQLWSNPEGSTDSHVRWQREMEWRDWGGVANSDKSSRWIEWNRRLIMKLFCQWRVDQERGRWIQMFKKLCTIVLRSRDTYPDNMRQLQNHTRGRRNGCRRN